MLSTLVPTCHCNLKIDSFNMRNHPYRWFENLKLILSGTTRPTRRGRLFKTVKPRKIPISRHYKKIRLSVSLNRFHVCYWVSFSMQSGVELFSGKLSSSSGKLSFLNVVSRKIL